MSIALLQKAISKKEAVYQEAIDRLRDAAAGDDADISAAYQLREAVELVGCLRRLLNGRTPDEVHRAFGAPGDFGYHTPIGDALSKVYHPVATSAEPKAQGEGGSDAG